jgi:CRISPR-associated exonuclease Cas4
MYCKRRWGLLEINNDWEENVLVIKANLIHENVHSKEHDYSSKTKKVFSTLSVYNDELDIYGVLDCVEFIKDDDGTLISELDDKYKVKIIEYKPTKPQNNEFWESDAIQVFAQKLCIDYIFNCNSEAYIYYSNIKRRIELPFYNDYDKYKKQITEYLHDMRYYLLRHEIPSISKGQKCSGCSLANICMPKCGPFYTRNKILSLMEDL